MMRYCPGCGHPISGRNEFCSDTCSKNWWLAGEDDGPSQLVPVDRPAQMVIEAAPIVIDEAALLDALLKVRKYGNKRVFQVMYTVTFQSDNPAGEWDKGLINSSLRQTMAGLMKELLSRSNNYFADNLWDIEVECTSDYDHLRSDHDGSSKDRKAEAIRNAGERVTYSGRQM